MENKLIAFFGSVLTLAIVIIVLSVLSGVVGDIQDDALADDSGTNIINESVTWTNKTFVALTHSPGTISLSCSIVYNNDTGSSWDGTTTGVDANATINSGNWTCTTGGINVTDFTIPGTTVNLTKTLSVSYNYKVGTSEYNISMQGVGGLVNVSEQFGNIGTIVAVVLIIGLLVGAFLIFKPTG